MTLMIGVDPHKGSHTAVAIDGDDVEFAAIEVRASARQIDELLGWAAGFADMTWAVEGAGGVGYLLAQQLVAAGERVLDVPATLAARVRVLGSGRNKNDPNDAYSIAVAARHAPKLEQVARADHAAVLRLLSKRNRELGSARTRMGCRLHALLVELVPGGSSKEITANRAAALLATVTPANTVEETRHALASEHLEDLRRLDEQMRTSKRRLAEAIRASNTTVTEARSRWRPTSPPPRPRRPTDRSPRRRRGPRSPSSGCCSAHAEERRQRSEREACHEQHEAAINRCVLPVPGAPRKITFSASARRLAHCSDAPERRKRDPAARQIGGICGQPAVAGSTA
jgi:Transposase